MKPIRVEPEAKQETEAAVGWYERRRQGLGLELLGELELGVRRAAARRFPYFIAFIEIRNVIRILAVAHERRRPGYWAARLTRR